MKCKLLFVFSIFFVQASIASQAMIPFKLGVRAIAYDPGIGADNEVYYAWSAHVSLRHNDWNPLNSALADLGVTVRYVEADPFKKIKSSVIGDVVINNTIQAERLRKALNTLG